MEAWRREILRFCCGSRGGERRRGMVGGVMVGGVRGGRGHMRGRWRRVMTKTSEGR